MFSGSAKKCWDPERELSSLDFHAKQSPGTHLSATKVSLIPQNRQTRNQRKKPDLQLLGTPKIESRDGIPTAGLLGQ